MFSYILCHTFEVDNEQSPKTEIHLICFLEFDKTIDTTLMTVCLVAYRAINPCSD